RVCLAELHALINQSPLLLRYECNQLSTQQFFEEVRSACGFTGDLHLFRQFFSDIFTAIEPMVQLHAQLRAQRVPTYIFSNTNELAIDQIRQQFPFFREFDGYILSYEHGFMKPDPALYEIVERNAGWTGAALLYIDDRPENIEVGRHRRWQT